MIALSVAISPRTFTEPTGDIEKASRARCPEGRFTIEIGNRTLDIVFAPAKPTKSS